MSKNTPPPVQLTLDGRTLATAYPHRRPTKRLSTWSWRMVWHREGAQHQRSLGRLAPKDVAEAMLEQWRAIDPASVEVDRRGVKTLTDLCRVWFATLEARPPDARLSENSLAMYRLSCEYIRDSIGDRPLAKLTPDDVRAMVDTMLEPAFRARRQRKVEQAKATRGQTEGVKANGRGYGHRTVNQAVSVLGIALNWGREHGYAVPDGIKPHRYRIKPRKGEAKPRYRSHTPSPAEVQTFYDALRRSPLKLAVLLAWRTGARVGELGGLRWGDVEKGPTGGFVRLSGKTGARRLALGEATLKEVLGYQPKQARAETPILSASFGRRGMTSLVHAQARQGIPRERQYGFHGLRRRWSIDQINAGVPVHVYADQSGHSPEVALRHYARVSDQDRRAALLRVEERGGGRDIYAFLAERGLDVAEAMALLEAALQARVEAGAHLEAAR